LNRRFDERPTSEWVTKAVAPYDSRMDTMQATMKGATSQLDQKIKAFEGELGKLSVEVLKQNNKLRTFATKADEEKLVEHMKRFAHYEDLKDLYNKCVPVVSNL